MFERGLAYRRKSSVNWCPVDNTVLANEQVVDGGCWRCGTAVETRDLEQWFFRITAYADELLDATETLATWPEKVLTMQRNWIGRSEGARVKFPLEADPAAQIEVFTTRIDTIYGATFVLLGPEHPLVNRLADRSPDPAGLKRQAQAFRLQDRAARLSGEIEKQGFDTGFRAVNPFTGRPVPIWVANFVLGEYGTGAVMAVPAHDERDFEFARKFNLPVRVVVTADGAPASPAGLLPFPRERARRPDPRRCERRRDEACGHGMLPGRRRCDPRGPSATAWPGCLIRVPADQTNNSAAGGRRL
jgi:leucyl-tRNA synthetase